MPEAMLSRRALLKGSLATGALTLDPRAALAASAPRRPEVAPGDGELPRRVLALYKSSELYNAVEGARPKTAWLNEVHAWAQMPLNWLGLGDCAGQSVKPGWPPTPEWLVSNCTSGTLAAPAASAAFEKA